MIINLILLIFFLQQKPTGDEILRRVEQTLAPVNDYVVDVQAEVNMERLRIPRMKATMYFKKPDKIHFESANFAMLPREGIALNPTWLREHFDATVERIDTVEGRRVQKLQLAAKDPNTRLRQLFVWVDTERWTVARLETIPYEGRSLTAVFHQSLHQGHYWLPDSMKANFGFAGVDTSSGPFIYQYAPQMNEMQRPPRSGSVKVSYANYRINVGLSDEIFERKENK